MSFFSDPLHNKLYADFGRSSLNWGPTGIAPGSEAIRHLLDLDPAVIKQRCLELARISGMLPRGVINPAFLPRYTSQRWDGQITFVRKTAEGLLACPAVAQITQVDGNQLNELADK